MLEEEALRADTLWLSPDGARLVGTHEPHVIPGGGTLFVWDVASGQRLLQYGWSSRLQLSTVFSPNGGTLATSGGDDKIQFWDAARGGRPEREVRLEGHWIYDLAFSPDGTAIAVASRSRDDRREPRVRLLDPRTGETYLKLGKAEGYAASLSFSLDGRLLAAAGHGSPARVWEVDSGGELAEIGGERDGPSYVAFGRDSRTVFLTPGSTAAARVFDLAAQADLLEIPSGAYCVTPGGGLLARVEGASILFHEIKRPALEGDRAALWEDLKGKDARRAYRAVWSLGAAKDGAAFLRERILLACEVKEEAAVRALVEDLDAERLETRTKAFETLAAYGEEIAPLLRKMRDGGLPAEARARVDALLNRCAGSKSPRLLARLRAIQALELAGASDVLRELSGKLPTEEERRRVRGALGRLGAH